MGSPTDLHCQGRQGLQIYIERANVTRKFQEIRPVHLKCGRSGAKYTHNACRTCATITVVNETVRIPFICNNNCLYGSTFSRSTGVNIFQAWSSDGCRTWLRLPFRNHFCPLHKKPVTLARTCFTFGFYVVVAVGPSLFFLEILSSCRIISG